jgi:hypothetical protein
MKIMQWWDNLTANEQNLYTVLFYVFALFVLVVT